MTRVIALGLDAAEPTLVDAEIAAGRLPHLARLRARSATAELASPMPFRAEILWTELTTGRRRDSLRYWSTLEFDPATYEAYTRGAADADPFYAFADGTPVVAFDLPKVVRSPAVRGVQAAGWGAHSMQYPVGSIPEGVLPDVTAHVGTHPAMAIEYAGSWHEPEFLDRFGAAQAAGARARSRALRHLAETNPDWRLLVSLFGETHQTGHVTYHGFGGLLANAPSAPAARTAMRSVLGAIDDAIGAIVEWAPPDVSIAVFSVQGMRPADDETAGSLVPELLLRTGAGETRWPGADLDAWRRAGAPPHVPHAWDQPTWLVARAVRARGALSRRERTRDLVWRHAPWLARARRRVRHPDHDDGAALTPTTYPFHDRSIDDWHPAAWYRDAWSRLPAFVIPSFSDVHVRLNVAGRERDGIVAPGDYDAACAAVERSLHACRDARTGGPGIVEITRVRTGDSLAPDGPPADLVVTCTATDALEHPEVGSLGPGIAFRTGSHTPSGFAFVAGPGIAPGSRGTRAVCDVSATICALLGSTPVGGLDGASMLASGEGR